MVMFMRVPDLEEQVLGQNLDNLRCTAYPRLGRSTEGVAGLAGKPADKTDRPEVAAEIMDMR
jgi:hypothetical protein